MSGDPPQRALDELSHALAEERARVAELLAVVDEHLAAGPVPPPPEGWAELRAMLESLRFAGLVRAIWVDDVADHFGLPPARSLAELAGAAPEPWSAAILRHRDELRRAVQAVTDQAEILRGRLGAAAAVPSFVPPSLADVLR